MLIKFAYIASIMPGNARMSDLHKCCTNLFSLMMRINSLAEMETEKFFQSL